jgi:hypothetical protein
MSPATGVLATVVNAAYVAGQRRQTINATAAIRKGTRRSFDLVAFIFFLLTDHAGLRLSGR